MFVVAFINCRLILSIWNILFIVVKCTLLLFLGDGDIEPEMNLSSISSMFKHPQRSSSRTIPLRPLCSLEEVSSSVKVVDEENEKHRGFRSSHLRSSFTSSAHQPSRSLYRSTRNIIDEDGGSEHEEQESPPVPHAWVEDPQNNSDMQYPLLRRSQWPPQKPQDEWNLLGLTHYAAGLHLLTEPKALLLEVWWCCQIKHTQRYKSSFINLIKHWNYWVLLVSFNLVTQTTEAYNSVTQKIILINIIVFSTLHKA